MRKTLFLGALLTVFILMACASHSEKPWQSDHYKKDEGFYNPQQIQSDFSFGRFLKIGQRFLFDSTPNTEAFGDIPIVPLSAVQLNDQQKDVVYRLGHSTILMKLSGQYILTDPVFSDRVSPVQWLGPKRFHPVPIDVNTLPDLFAVMISHDHYDHLDEGSIKLLVNRVEHFFVPLGVAKYLQEWGVAREKIHELDWWQSKQIKGFEFVSTPAQHFSGRGVFNRNSTLWSSWVIKAPEQRIFFSGDSGYFDGFKTIGEKYGPFDLTILENGAYNTDWPQVHMFPEQTVQAHIDLKGKAMLPVHNGTFKLSFHPWFEPLENVTTLGEAQGLLVQTPKMGRPLNINQPQVFEKWWQEATGAL